MISFVKGYSPDWNCRYAPYMLGMKDDYSITWLMNSFG